MNYDLYWQLVVRINHDLTTSSPLTNAKQVRKQLGVEEE